MNGQNAGAMIAVHDVPSGLDERGRSIESLIEAFAEAGALRQRVADLVGHVVAAHSTALERLLALAADPDVLENDRELAEVLWVHRPVTDDAEPFDRYGNQIESLLSAIEQSAGPELIADAAELAYQVGELYGEQLERAFELLHHSGQGDAIRAALDDDLVTSMLVVHGLHPLSMGERIADCLAELLEALPEHGGAVHLSGIDEQGRVRIEIDGGSELYRWRTRLAVEKAIDRAAPEHGGIEVIGADAEPPTSGGLAFIPLDSIRRKSTARTPRVWIDVPELLELVDGETRHILAGDTALLVCNVVGDLYVIPDSSTAAAGGISETAAVTNGAAGGTAGGATDLDSYRIVGHDPLTVENGRGARVVFDKPLPVQRTDHTVEVMVP